MCHALDQNTAVQEEVQTRVTELNTALSMLSALPSIVLALFIGPWSDRHGRKPVMLLPQLGYILSTLVWILNVHFMVGRCKLAWWSPFFLTTAGLASPVPARHRGLQLLWRVRLPVNRDVRLPSRRHLGPGPNYPDR